MLEDLRILDLTRFLSGPYGSMLLADLGAEVIKIEAKDGDPARTMPPYFISEQYSAYFASLNRNKKSISLDLTKKEGKEAFYDLVRLSDVVFDNFRPGVMKKLLCDYEVLKEINPRIICCSLTGYGLEGEGIDLPAFDISIQALSGGMSITGEEGRSPVRMGISIADLAAGVFAAYAIVSALFERIRTGQGKRLDVSMLDCQMSLLNYLVQYHFFSGEIPKPMGSGYRSAAPGGAFRTADGYIVFAFHFESFWQGFCKALSMEQYVDDPRFRTNANRVENKDILSDIIQEKIVSKTVAEWTKILRDHDIPCAPVNTLDQALNLPQLQSRNMTVDIYYPHIRQCYKSIGNPIKVSDMQEEFRSAPLLAEHSEEVLFNLLQYSEERVAHLREIDVVN